MQVPEITLEDDTHIYHFDTGKVFIKLKTGIVKETGLSKDKDGYYQIVISYKMYKVHRILFEKYYSMKIPSDKCIDHINRIKTNNRIENLRMISRIENSQNRSIQINNTSGYKNINWKKDTNKWGVRLSNKIYGSFDDLQQAILHRNLMIGFLNNTQNTKYTILD